MGGGARCVLNPADAVQTQALLFKRVGLSTFQQTRMFFRYTKRLA